MKFLGVLLLTLVVGCVADSTDDNDDSDPSAFGLWQGTVTSSSGYVNGIIASNGKAYFQTESGVLTFGTVSVSGNNFSYNGTAYASAVTPFSMTMAGTVVTDSINVTFTTPLETGTFSFAKANASFGVYDRSSDLTKLEGIWNDSELDSLGTWVFTINDTGSFTAERSGSESCSMTGQFSTINTSKNELSVSTTITSCGGSNGSYSGYAFTSDADTFTDNVINLAFENGQSAGIFKAVKQ